MLDDTDRHILKILAESGREPLKRLARTVGLSRSATTARLRRLERGGFIRGYRAVLSTEASERSNKAVLLVRLARTPDHEAVEAIKGLDAVIQCRSLAGDIDLIVDVAADSVEALNRTRDQVSAIDGVSEVRTHLVLAIHIQAAAD